MAKTGKIETNERRKKMVARYAAKRKVLRDTSKNIHLTQEEREEARIKLQKLPRNSLAIRIRSRCEVTGRPRAVFKKFGLCRNTFRDLALKGEIPGVTKASW